MANNPSWTHFSPDYLPLPDGCLRVLAWVTIGWELLFPLLVLMPLTRAATLWIGVFFHVGTLIHLEVGLFPLYALVLLRAVGAVGTVWPASARAAE